MTGWLWSMKIVWVGLLLSACGRPPQAGRVYRAAGPELVLGLAKTRAGAYELRLCKDGATAECINPLMTAEGEAYGFTSEEKSGWAQSVRYGAAGLAGLVGGAVFFKGARYFLRRGAATDLARQLSAAQVEKQLGDQGQELPQTLRRALQRRRLSRDEARQLLTLRDQHNIDIEQEADLLAAWDKHVAELRDALQQGKAFVFKKEFDLGLKDLRGALQTLPAQKGALAELDELAEALRRNKLSQEEALTKLTALERQVDNLIDEDWSEALQQARQTLASHTSFDGRPAVKKGLQAMLRPLAKLGRQASGRRLQRLAKDGTRRAEEIEAELAAVPEKVARNLLVAVREAKEGKLNQRAELLRVLQDLELTAQQRQLKKQAKELKKLAKEIQGGKANQSVIAARMRGIDRDWQQVKDVDNEDSWRRGLGELDAILTADDSLDDYEQLSVALRELQQLLVGIDDQGRARQISRLERRLTERLERTRSLSSSELDSLSERAIKVARSSRKYQKTLKQLEQGSAELLSGLEDSGIVRPQASLSRSLETLENVLQKLAAEDELVYLKKLQADLSYKRLSREELENSLTALDESLRQGEYAETFNRWQESLAEVKALLRRDRELFKPNLNLTSVWDDMASTLQASQLRKTFADEVKELQRYTLDSNRQEDVLRRKLEQLDARVRKAGSFRTADELHAVQGQERRAARQELRQRIAELRQELRAGVKTQAASLDAALRAGERVRKSNTGKIRAWFNYGDGGERIIDRAQVLTTLKSGQQPDAIAVRVGLEKLAAQLTGAAIFVALVLPTDESSPDDIEALLQRIAPAVDARITPTASCLLGACAAAD